MNDVLKQRLVGALILLALGVVFWPIVFVQPEEKSNVGQRSIPQPPGVATTPIDEPDSAGLRASADRVEDEEMFEPDSQESGNDNEQGEFYGVGTDPSGASAEPLAATEHDAAAVEIRTEAPQPLAVDRDGVPVAWTLQVATVSSHEKAESLRQRLLQKSEKAYITTVSSGGKTLYRVCIGPKFERHELERMQAGINAEFGVKTMLVRYTP